MRISLWEILDLYAGIVHPRRTGTIGIESHRMTDVADGADGEQVEVSGSDMDCSSCREWMTSQLPAREWNFPDREWKLFLGPAKEWKIFQCPAREWKLFSRWQIIFSCDFRFDFKSPLVIFCDWGMTDCIYFTSPDGLTLFMLVNRFFKCFTVLWLVLGSLLEITPSLLKCFTAFFCC